MFILQISSTYGLATSLEALLRYSPTLLFLRTRYRVFNSSINLRYNLFPIIGASLLLSELPIRCVCDLSLARMIHYLSDNNPERYFITGTFQYLYIILFRSKRIQVRSRSYTICANNKNVSPSFFHSTVFYQFLLRLAITMSGASPSERSSRDERLRE